LPEKKKKKKKTKKILPIPRRSHKILHPYLIRER